jgi:DNA-binding CsgD family transcriptional regulator
MLDFQKFIESTNGSHNSEEVFKTYAEAMGKFGFDRICYSLLTDHPSLELNAGHGILRNYSEDWMKHYIDNGYVGIDPVPSFCFKTNRPFKWEWLTKNVPLKRAALKVMEEAREAQLLDGLAIPIHGLSSELAGVGMASSSGKTNISPDEVYMIRALTLQFHLSFTEKETAAEKIRHIYLTPREREVLSWAAEGKSDQVISEIVGLSYATIRFHMSNIFLKLEVNERTLAVMKAVRHGLIKPALLSS